MVVRDANLFIQAGLSLGSDWRSGSLRRAPHRPWCRMPAETPLIGSTSGWEASTDTPGFSTAAVHEDEPAIIGSRSGGQI